MSRFAEVQPRAGEIVAGCGHAEGVQHWFDARSAQAVPPMDDGCRAAWIRQCEACFAVARETGRFRIAGHGAWTGDAPVIEAPH